MHDMGLNNEGCMLAWFVQIIPTQVWGSGAWGRIPQTPPCDVG